ncbi:unnamed protein product, partial [Pylaiella littoralis]
SASAFGRRASQVLRELGGSNRSSSSSSSSRSSEDSGREVNRSTSSSSTGSETDIPVLRGPEARKLDNPGPGESSETVAGRSRLRENPRKNPRYGLIAAVAGEQTQAFTVYGEPCDDPEMADLLAELEEKTNTHIRSFLEERAAIRSLMEQRKEEYFTEREELADLLSGIPAETPEPSKFLPDDAPATALASHELSVISPIGKKPDELDPVPLSVAQADKSLLAPFWKKAREEDLWPETERS